MTTYDDWKTTDPNDRFLGPEPPPCEQSYRHEWDHPRFPSGDCRVCGAMCTEGCKHENMEPWEKYQTGPDPDAEYEQRRDDKEWDR